MTAMPIQREQFFRGCTFLLFVGMSWACADGGTEPSADPPQPTTVALTPASATLTALGASLHLIADVRDQYGQVMSGTTVSWTSNSVQVASVDGVGVVTAVANGSATITATVGSATAGADITVAQVVSAVTVSATSDTLAQGYTLQFAAEGRDANGHAATAAEFSWASSDTTVSKVDQTGLATGVGPGRANIVAVSSGVAGQRALRVMAPLNSDLEALRALYQATNGANWLRNQSWLTERPLGNWSGVQVDGDGRVVRLQLNNNNLIGRIPPELGLLDRLETLVLRSNTLTGTIPSELGGLDSLRELVLFGNDLTGHIPPELGELANLESLVLHHNDLNGPIPPELGQLVNLKHLDLWENELTGQIPEELANLVNLETMTLIQNRLSGPISPEMGKLANLEQMALDGNRLSGSLPAELGNLVRLESLGLNSNRITGPIPPELGNLTNLQYLNLSNNDLTGHMPSELRGLASLTYASLGYNRFAGPIPPELGKLYKLEFLDLRHNELTGSIPPELSSLSRLTNLWLHDNQLTGSIPDELAKLGNLQLLLLQGNALTGPIPSTMSSLASLEYLELARNNLTGPIPKELGQLADLISLVVADNNMTGSVPDEIGQLGRLRGLNLSGNARMSGALPASLVSLRSLTRFLAAGTDLCAPAGPAFQTWLDGLRRQRVKTCGAAEVRAYLTQAVQSREFPVPLVADQDALLRVFVTAVRPVGDVIPDVRARFFIGDAETHVVNIAARQTPIPDAVDQGSLSKSANELIPGSIVQPGLEMVIEVDPHGKLAPGSGVQKRIPETGRMSIDVKPMPTLSLTIVPFLWSAKPDSLVLETVRAMSESPGSHELLGPTLALLPIGDIAVTTHETVLTSSNSGYRILHATEALRVLEGGHGHYMGTMTGPLEHGYGGAYPWGRSSFSTIDRPNSAHTIAHELGHNMSLQHPPGCGAALADYGFPHPNGVIGSWGYDFAEGRLVPPETGDLMSYCHRDAWISEYHRTNAVRWRLRDEGAAADLVPAPVRSLLLWGGVDDSGNAFLEPSFAVDAPATMPAEGGEYSLTGSSTDGRILFSFSFGMQVADGNGNHSFVFALPVEPKWAGQLSAITLAGPDGSVTLDGASDQGMVILRNPVTGQVRGMLRVPPVEAGVHHEVAALQGELRLEILYSRGIPDVTAWER